MWTTPQTDQPLALSVGRLYDPGSTIPRTLSGVRSTVGTSELWRIAVTTATSGFTYQIRGRRNNTVTGSGEWRTVEFTTSTTAPADLRDGLFAAWNADSVLAGVATASAASSGTAIDFTAITPGVAGGFDVEIVANSNSALAAPSEITAGADTAETAFGTYALIDGRGRSGNVDRPQYSPLSPLAGAVMTLTPTHAASQTVFYSFTAEAQTAPGVREQATYSGSSIATGANLAALIANIEADLTTQLDGTGAEISNDGTDITVEFPVGFTVLPGAQAGGSGGADLTISTVAGDNAPNPASVVFVYDDGTETPATIGGTVTGYAGDRSAGLFRGGCRVVAAAPPTSPSVGGIVWIETAAGSNLGRPYATPAPSRFAHASHAWEQADTVNADIAIINGGA